MKKTNVSVLVFVSDQKLIYMTSFQVKKLKMLSASDLIHLLFAQLHSGRDFGRHEQAPEILLGNLIFNHTVIIMSWSDNHYPSQHYFVSSFFTILATTRDGHGRECEGDGKSLPSTEGEGLQFPDALRLQGAANSAKFAREDVKHIIMLYMHMASKIL